jgi:predicted cupin superfamily sugar epimerase
MKMLDEEGTYVRELYRSELHNMDGEPVETAMYGLYCHDPESQSSFHVLTHDEVWSFYEGDCIELFLLYPDGSDETVLLGNDIHKGEVYQYTIPAGVYQGARLKNGGEYALYGCTVAPGFTMDCFTKGNVDLLKKKYPDMKNTIEELK